jgi:hypothetical protein
MTFFNCLVYLAYNGLNLRCICLYVREINVGEHKPSLKAPCGLHDIAYVVIACFGDWGQCDRNIRVFFSDFLHSTQCDTDNLVQTVP